MEICVLIQINLRSIPKWWQPLKNKKRPVLTAIVKSVLNQSCFLWSVCLCSRQSIWVFCFAICLSSYVYVCICTLAIVQVLCVCILHLFLVRHFQCVCFALSVILGSSSISCPTLSKLSFSASFTSHHWCVHFHIFIAVSNP